MRVVGKTITKKKTLDDLVKPYIPMEALTLKEEPGRARLLNYHQALEESFIKQYKRETQWIILKCMQ